MALKKTLLISLIFVGLITAGWLIKTNSKPASFQNISVQEFDAALESGDPFVVDVHIPEQTHLPGTDAFINYQEIGQHLAEFPQNKDAEILVYCRSGSMGSTASQVLAEAGYTNVKNLVGGVNAWREAHQGLSLTPSTQDLGTVVYGDVPTTQFTLTNSTAQTVNLTRISTSCSCTQAQADSLSLEPNQSSLIRVSFNPAVHKDDHDLGQVTRTIFIDTDHPNFPQLQSTITANVIK